MKVQHQAMLYNQAQVRRAQSIENEAKGSVLPVSEATNSRTKEAQFDFTHITKKELSQASKALYDEGILDLGQHASLSLHYFAVEQGLSQRSGLPSPADISQAENEKIDVIAMQKASLREARRSGRSETEIQFSEKLLNTLENYQYGGKGRFFASA